MANERLTPSEPVTLEARRSERLQMLWCGEMVLRGGRYDCRVVDISQHGARIATEADASPGDDGLLLCEGLDILFRVVRRELDGIAVVFVEEEAEGGKDDIETVSRQVRNEQVFRYLSSGLGAPVRRHVEG